MTWRENPPENVVLPDKEEEEGEPSTVEDEYAREDAPDWPKAEDA